MRIWLALIFMSLFIPLQMVWADDEDEGSAPPPPLEIPEITIVPPSEPDSSGQPLEFEPLEPQDMPEMTSSFWSENCQARVFRPAQHEKEYLADLKLEENARRRVNGILVNDARDLLVLDILKAGHLHANSNLPRYNDHFPVALNNNRPLYNAGSPQNSNLVLNQNGDARLARAYDLFRKRSDAFLYQMSDQSTLQREMLKCTDRTRGLINPNSVFLRDVELTKRVLLSRYILSQFVHQEMIQLATRYHSENALNADERKELRQRYNQLKRKLVLARTDVVKCPLNIWQMTKSLFLERPLNPKQRLKCSVEEFGQLRDRFTKEFDMVIETLQPRRSR